LVDGVGRSGAGSVGNGGNGSGDSGVLLLVSRLVLSCLTHKKNEFPRARPETLHSPSCIHQHHPVPALPLASSSVVPVVVPVRSTESQQLQRNAGARGNKDQEPRSLAPETRETPAVLPICLATPAWSHKYPLRLGERDGWGNE
jgi:hypothetical protein